MQNYRTAGQAADDNMAHSHCMLDTKVYKHHSEYVILIAFPQQQWVQERVSLLCLNVECLSCFKLSAVSNSGPVAQLV